VVSFPKAHIIRPSADKKPGGVIPGIAIASTVTLETDDLVLTQLVDLIQNKAE
jgi:hypothetical protein